MSSQEDKKKKKKKDQSILEREIYAMIQALTRQAV